MKSKMSFSVLALFLFSGVASAFTPAQMRLFYSNCQHWQHFTPAQKQKVIAGTRYSVAQVAASCRLTLSRSLSQNIALENEYQRAIHSRRRQSGGSGGEDDTGSPTNPAPSRDVYNGPNVCPDGSRGTTCQLSPDGTYHGPNLCPNGQYGTTCNVCPDGSYGC